MTKLMGLCILCAAGYLLVRTWREAWEAANL